MARCGCASATVCNCLLQAGDNVTVSGTGQPGNPYIISANEAALVTEDSPSLTLILTPGDPDTLTGTVNVDTAAGNLLTVAAGGLRVDCDAVAACGAGPATGGDTDTTEVTVAAQVVTVDVLVDAAPGNLIEVVPGGAPGGLRVDCEEVRTCFTPGSGIDAAALALGIVAADVSGDAGNAITFGADQGLFAPAAAAPALQVLNNVGSGVTLTLTGTGTQADPWVLSATAP